MAALSLKQVRHKEQARHKEQVRHKKQVRQSRCAAEEHVLDSWKTIVELHLLAANISSVKKIKAKVKVPAVLNGRPNSFTKGAMALYFRRVEEATKIQKELWTSRPTKVVAK